MSIASFTDIELSTIKHICLSYVWGSSQNLMLRSDNTKDLMTDGAISSKRPPKTIADGIYLTEALGFDYLWVDALCILQDDDDDKRVQIGYMHAIYQMAFMTIIAASGNNADAGLPGLWPGTRSVVPEEVIIKKATDIDPGITLLTTLSPRRDSGQNHLAQTTWNSRGWTMQERVLSRRVLAFTDEQVHFACQKAIFCEESYFENSAVPFIRFQGNAQELNLQGALRVSYESTDPADRFWRRYRALVKDFTCRRFTFDGDVYDGFLAITTALSQISEETFLWGLPRSRFEFGLWWTTFSGHIRRDSLSTLPMTSLNIKVRFPSWTWIGWVGEAWVSVGDDRWETGEAPEITCYVHYDSPLRVLKVADTVSSSHPTQVPCIEEGNTELRNQWKPDHDLTVSVEDIEIHLKNVYDKLVEIPEEHIIFFWTSLATFTLEPVSTQGNQNTAPRILDSTGKQVGTMGIMKNEYWQSGHYDRGEHEFVVIGSRRFYTFDPILAVLQIERREGIAYRVNIGEINEEDWVKAQRGWTLVALQ
ncbi:HET-domain-containing protein [Serendipita vermifera]|nr:HET-domain-containing protein [Serendipita vermifera]